MNEEYELLQKKALQSLTEIVKDFPNKEEIIPETLKKIEEFEKKFEDKLKNNGNSKVLK